MYGAARKARSAGLLMLLALASLLFVPGTPGFPTLVHLLAEIIEQRSLFYLAAESLLLALLCLTAIRLATDLIFRRRGAANGEVALGHTPFRYSALDRVGLAAVVVGLFAWGLGWQRAFALLSESAKAFLK